MSTINIPIINIFLGTGDDVRLARTSDCMYQLPYGSYAWCPQGLPTELYPYPRVNLIDRQSCHEALLGSFKIEFNTQEDVALEIARVLHSSVNEEVGFAEFTYLLISQSNPEKAENAFFSVFSSANDALVQMNQMEKRDPVLGLTNHQNSRIREGKPLLVILPPPVEYYPDEPGPSHAVKEVDGQLLITVDDIKNALLFCARKENKTVLQFLNWIQGFSFDDMTPQKYVPVIRETVTVPDHVLYMSDVPNKAMIYSAKTRKYYPA